LHAVSFLLVYDNSEKYDENLERNLVELSNKIQYTYFGENAGIAVRLNQAIQKAKSMDESFLLTMDQDSSFQLGDIEKYLTLISDNKIKGVAQFGINCQPEFTPQLSVPEKAVSLITSGSILQLQYMDAIGGFDEKLFIDFVDTAFSYSVTNKGFVNLLCSNIVLNHQIGTTIEGRSLLTLKKSPRIIHSPIRVYYIIRNGLYLLYRHKGLSAIQRKDIRRSMKIVKNDFIYHPQLFTVYKFALVAIKDAIFNIMGKRY
jgi:rhamnosyltransferase